MAAAVEWEDTWTKGLHTLSPRRREVLELAREEYSIEETASQLGIEPNNVRQQRYQAAQQLQKFQRQQDAVG